MLETFVNSKFFYFGSTIRLDIKDTLVKFSFSIFVLAVMRTRVHGVQHEPAGGPARSRNVSPVLLVIEVLVIR